MTGRLDSWEEAIRRGDTETVIVFRSTNESYARGAAAWDAGDPLPPVPADTDPMDVQLFWVGYMAARSRDWFRRRAMALYPDRVDPRP